MSDSIIMNKIGKNIEKIHYFSIDEEGPFICFNPSPKTIRKIKIIQFFQKYF